jgi:hypothetical protein
LNQAKTKAESTSAGEQHVIPGAEKISDAEVAKRKAAEPLKPKVGQKPATKACLAIWLTRPILSTSPRSLEWCHRAARTFGRLALSAILNVVAGNSPVLGVAGEMDNYVDDCAGCDGDHVRDDTEVNPKLSTQHRQREEDADQD